MPTKITRSYFSIFQIDNHHLRGNLKDYHVRLLLLLLLLPKKGIENETWTETGTRSDFVRFALCKHTHGINRFPLSFCTSRVLYIASLVSPSSALLEQPIIPPQSMSLAGKTLWARSREGEGNIFCRSGPAPN